MKILCICIIICCTPNIIQGANRNVDIKKSLEEHQGRLIVNKSKTKTVPLKIENVTKVTINKKVPKQKKKSEELIKPKSVQAWAKEISDVLLRTENLVVHRGVLQQGFSDAKVETRNGTAIVDKAAKDLEKLLERRGQAAEAIMRKAEELAAAKPTPPDDYVFDYSVRLDELKTIEEPDNEYEKLLTCRSISKVHLHKNAHFDAQVSLEKSSVHVALEVFDCDPRALDHIYWSEGLLRTFQDNYAQDATLDFQYFCSARGFLRHYPAALWKSFYKIEDLEPEGEELYDCRLRPWYVSASGAPRDVLILLDASGSMNRSINSVVGEHFTLALLSALTDDDQVNVLRFNIKIESPIPCFNEKMVSANHVNSAAMMAAMKHQRLINETNMELVLKYAVKMLHQRQKATDKPPSCQQAIVLLTDSLDENFTSLMEYLDPEGNIRLFVMWLHDPQGLRDSTQLYSEQISCDRDGYFAELITDSDITEQVMNILRVLERPLVLQREKRLRVYSDLYANIEEPRRSEFYWGQKEDEEQSYRYMQLRKNKKGFLHHDRQYSDLKHLYNLDNKGQYYEGEDVKYRYQITVSVPVFDHTTSENITKVLGEEKQRNATRTYPVNRLLGVVGIDIPIAHLKLVLPYYLVGAGGSLFIVDHRGNIVIHDDIEPVFDSDILKPGYRTVDFMDVEQPAADHLPRHYPEDWFEFRNTLVVKAPSGTRMLYAKNILDGGMRALFEMRQYSWRRVMDHYTVVVALPPYGQRHVVPGSTFSQGLAEKALEALSGTEFSVHPEWLYCQHVDPHFDREAEVLHFIRRRRDEPKFLMQKLNYLFTPIAPALLEKTYQCNEELMARLCEEAVMSADWAKNEPADHDCKTCELGSVTAFFASESGLTRWQLYHATSPHAEPPEGREWARGPEETYYARAHAHAPRLVVHAPAPPRIMLRNTARRPKPLGEKWRWLTAARALALPSKAGIGVTGYHFHPQHLEDLLDKVTNFPCEEEDCEPRCDNEAWACVLIDEDGWIVANMPDENKKEEDDQALVREHLATSYPTAMAALLNASVFHLKWIHDYQAVCFPPEDEDSNAAAPRLPTILRAVWGSIRLMLHVTKEMLTLITVLASALPVRSDTEYEKEKRRRRLKKDYEREKFESLFNPRVLVNRTRFAACDRSRAIYEFQHTNKSLEALRQPAHVCKWPLVGALVPDTNLILLAVYKGCPYTGRPINDPLVNEPVSMAELEQGAAGRGGSAAKLACWRNRVPLPARAPHAACYPHQYAQEEGYRQCGPWLPDKDAASIHHLSVAHLLTMLLLVNA
ncbi:voltage-dependent calcium channel subunit alpha-2/delta-3-like [Aricia agestis]|uniref:voltage-dependent calcium channel subunit alpha-2/delta-3-like n=1 Tax=Aricia agestis TaxID=91739 RepID=UPI001C202BB7|nr:voltage-dependent calcium channel subunit alpha-2/delta-3-like [Aricia agestis]